nr:MAG TPA: hypothetical protein [Caudoviricetes sp.]
MSASSVLIFKMKKIYRNQGEVRNGRAFFRAET